MKKYVSGKIGDRPEEEYREEFARGAAFVLSQGDQPVTPMEVIACEAEDCNPEDQKLSDGSYLHSWACYIRYDLLMMLECDGIVMLPSWRTSPGANFELDVAEKCGLQVQYLANDFRSMRRG